MDIQVKSTAMATMFWNQVKTVLEAVVHDMYVRREIEAEMRMQ